MFLLWQLFCSSSEDRGISSQGGMTKTCSLRAGFLLPTGPSLGMQWVQALPWEIPLNLPEFVVLWEEDANRSEKQD